MSKLLIILFTLITSCTPTKNTNNLTKGYCEGRVITTSEGIELMWPGSAVTFKIKGKYLDVNLIDDKGENDYSIIIDGKETGFITPSKEVKTYRLLETSTLAEHTITLHKRTDYSRGTTLLSSVETDGELLPVQPKKKHIEFYGNSITVGYANIDTTGEDNSEFTNNYVAFSALTARHFNAELTCIAKSGIGVMVSWFDLIMPELYDRHNPNDANSKWDFTQKTPDVVVVNLCQNDYWILGIPNNEFYIKKFGRQAPTPEFIINAYQEFIENLKSKYPSTPIVCVLGVMNIVDEGSPWPSYITKAVENIGDDTIHTLILPYLADSAHPNVKEHKKMSELLISFLEDKELL
ncbi:electron transporter RnfD [Flammeovirga pectinis]|uniref:Electron transporter RnfD n=1 Tax=Flammeovirga pectinis TaxID=2494373 RepID=A0A3Q9FV44_9BACT|nr:SGNH/GDSL hydrolase family protein [Flammeovirga pectinis]AZQ65267.1 electron transporter RnfD [Flammeovirga pectinis]